MVFTNVIRRAASRVIPSAVRGIGSQKCYHHQSLFSSAAPIAPTAALSQNLSRYSFSTVIQRIHARKRKLVQQPSTTRRDSDDALLKVLNSEIQCAQETNDNYEIENVPKKFPFKIIDEPGKGILTLTRDDYGESITVEVQMPDPPIDEEDENDDESDSNDESDTKDENDTKDESDDAELVLSMAVKVTKNDGPCFKFNVSAYLDKIEIEDLSIEDPATGEEDATAYHGPDFGDLDEALQEAFHKYLDNRGINSSSTKFLHEYMTKKESKEYEEWLKKAKTILEA